MAIEPPAVFRGAPLLGVLPEFVRSPTTLLTRAARENPGRVVVLPLGPTRSYLLADPAHVQHFLADNWRNYGKGGMWKPTRRLVGDGVLTSSGERWVKRRRLLRSVFSPQNLSALVATFADHAAIETGRLRSRAAPGEVVDVSTEMMRLVQTAFLKTLFGTAVDAHDVDRVGTAIVRALRAINLRSFAHFIPQWLFPGDRALRRDIGIIDDTILRLVGEERSRAEVGDLLSQLRSAEDPETGDRLSHRELRDELVTFFVAGNDTTAVGATWVWHVLDRHPDVASRVREELDRVVGSEVPTFEALQRLDYTQTVIRETLRLFPVGWLIPRIAIEEDRVGGVTIPAGANVFVSQYVTHRDPRWWERPDEFDPSRFADGAPARPRFAYFPFGGGPRQCVGSRLGMAMLLTIVAVVGRKVGFRRASSRPVSVESTITLRPRGGLPMRVEAR